MTHVILSISVMKDRLAVCRLSPGDVVPDWAAAGGFYSLTRSTDELSIICREENVPHGVKCERDWRAFRLEGPFDFNMVGVLASVLDPLADAGISILAIGTYDTDYVLVKEGHLERAVVVLSAAGHIIRRY